MLTVRQMQIISYLGISMSFLLPKWSAILNFAESAIVKVHVIAGVFTRVAREQNQENKGVFGNKKKQKQLISWKRFKQQLSYVFYILVESFRKYFASRNVETWTFSLFRSRWFLQRQMVRSVKNPSSFQEQKLQSFQVLTPEYDYQS